MSVRLVLLLAAASWLLLLASVGFFLFQGARADKANCEVIAVLLDNRADRDKTVKLFDPIRRQNPAQFDKLVKRAEAGDRRLKRVQGDLACDLK